MSQIVNGKEVTQAEWLEMRKLQALAAAKAEAPPPKPKPKKKTKKKIKES